MEKSCRLSNTTHWDIAPSLSLPSLPVSCGTLSSILRLSDDGGVTSSMSATDVLSRASAIADFLARCDVSYLNVKEEVVNARNNMGDEPSWFYNEVLKYNSTAFDLFSRGLTREQNCHIQSSERKSFDQNSVIVGREDTERKKIFSDQTWKNCANDGPSSTSSRKQKIKKKEHEPVSLSAGADSIGNQVGKFSEAVDDFCGRAEVSSGDQEDLENASLPLSDVKRLVDEILSIRTKKVLSSVPVNVLTRLLVVLDHQILCGQGLSVDNADADAVSLIVCALESTYASLAVMAHQDMPKQLYKEEIIERILDFSRHQVMDIMAVCDPSYRTINRPSENGTFDRGEDDEDDADISSAVKKRSNKNVILKKLAGSGNKVSAIVHTVIQRLCSIFGFLKDLLSIEKLSDSCILQLAKTSFSTFLADNIQLLQLKAIGLICGVYASYAQHRNFLIDETVQLVWKLPFSKRANRSYHLPDEEQKQIQMITALLIQLTQCSASLPEILKTRLSFNSFSDASIEASYPSKCQKAATETCCHFWTGVVERFTTAKTQELSESRFVVENLVMDLLTTLNLPEFPASAPILEVLCVLLLQNAGLKSKDVTARCVTIELLGTIAARLKHDSVMCSKDHFWIIEAITANTDDFNGAPDKCAVCREERSADSLIACHGCQRCFHAECVGAGVQDNLFREWFCHICVGEKQLMVLHSYCESHTKDNAKKNFGATKKTFGTSSSISISEVIQQMLLDYLQEVSSEEDPHLSTRWFYLCQWYKDDPLYQDRSIYYLARLKSKAILRDFGTTSIMSREWAKKICLALGQNNSFSRGFDKILSLLLASLRENFPVIRAKALRAVSGIVEVDPEVLCDKRVQCAVEGRFCDSAISVREAALELVGRHIASHPDVGLKYFEKVAERIKDTGVSVRKRAIKIIRDMCLSNSNFSNTTTAFTEIIARVGDEESSIQDLVCKTFYEFWFEEPSSTQTQFVSDGSSVPLEVAKKTEQIVDLLRKMPNYHPLVAVIKRNLSLDFLPQSAKGSGINVASLASVRRRCELMCKRLLERILQVEEANNDEDGVQALPYVLGIQAFCVVDPTLCAPATDPSQFVVTLQPYLKNQVDNRLVAQLLESIIFVIDSVLPLLRKPSLTVFEELEQDLKHMIVRHSYLTVVHACIRCLCSLSKITGNGATLIEYLVQVFFKQLQLCSAENKQLLGRSLFCLGLLIRYGNCLLVSSTGQNDQAVRSLQLIKKYLLQEDFSLKVRSLQALGFILIATPEYMLEVDIKKIIEASLSSDVDERLKMQALQNLFEYLLDAESQMGKDSTCSTGNRHLQDMSVSTVPIAAGAGDTNICGGIIQLYWAKILDNCINVNDQIRQLALKIVEVVSRQGLVHPVTCVPYLVALETDPQEVNSKLAHHLLMNMNEKYPSIFESRLGDGLQMSFRFFQSMAGINNVTLGSLKAKSSGSAFVCVKPGISRIYRIIRGNRNSRNKFMHSIVKKFEPGCWNASSIPFLVYCTEVLASLPFACPDEPLYLIYDINRIVQVRAGPIESNMKMWSSSFFQDDSTERYKNTDEVNQEELGDYGIRSRSGVANEINSGHPDCISEDNLRKFQADCHDAIALQLLLKLKRHLKVSHGLNDARCQAFSLKDHPKPGETLSRQSIPFNIHEESTSLPTTYKDMIDKYQELKQLLKDDTIDYSIYSSSIKRKRPTSRNSRAKTASAIEDDDDEDWTGGPRKLNFSGQKCNNGRVTRQRF